MFLGKVEANQFEQIFKQNLETIPYILFQCTVCRNFTHFHLDFRNIFYRKQIWVQTLLEKVT